ncbi:zinc ABC transporter substrate-binding protein [Patescibacteria group bacterium]|nr:zinc ABC transporter substrate-binding protein [Patescibacteria group bacterium]MCL5114180.1 zinc ABC transporter substrate-binding protein [Patescibacteria group bacterium]
MTKDLFKVLYPLVGVVIIATIAYVLAMRHPTSPAPTASNGVLRIVAAENFWGSLVSQIGGSQVDVLSIVSDPNADPHEYESNASTARAVATANYVIENGAGYDSWMGKLVGAGSNPGRVVLDVARFLGKKSGDNPHFWYNPEYVNRVAKQMEADLAYLDPAHASYYTANYARLMSSLAVYQSNIADMKAKFAGAEVAATEDIFSYLAQASGLDLVSPPEFIQAVAEGNSPSPAAVVEFENQLKSGTVKVLVYNKQTVTPLTDNMKKLAASEGIPVVAITETIEPPTLSFEDWMNGEITSIENALQSQ